MRPVATLLFGIVLAHLALSPAQAAPAGGLYEYISPRDSARMVSAHNNVVIRTGAMINPASLPAPPAVFGTAGDLYGGTWVLSADSKTLIFKPAIPFTPGD